MMLTGRSISMRTNSQYVANASSATLESLITESLLLLELRFQSFDVDGAGCVVLIDCDVFTFEM